MLQSSQLYLSGEDYQNKEKLKNTFIDIIKY